MANVKGGVIAKQEVARKQPSEVKKMQDLVKMLEPQIKKALPQVLTGERFSRMLLTAISTNKQLAHCTPQSFMGAIMQAAQLGLEPNTPLGQAYLIPYKNKGVLECQFQLGYKGLIDLAYRSGAVKDIQAHEVHENDEFTYELGLEAKLIHRPAMSNRGKVIAYYAVFHTKDGGYGFEVMSRDDVLEHAQSYSQAFGSSFSPWKKFFDEMAKKTVLKKCLKYAPVKTEFVRAVENDETIKYAKSGEDIGIIADLPDETEYTDIEAHEVAAVEVRKCEDDMPSNVDPETGEVRHEKSEQEQKDDAILANSLNL